MGFARFIQGVRRFTQAFGYSGYDRRGDLKYLAGRSPDPAALDIDGVDPAVRDEALLLLCDAFDIPERQRYCLRLDDRLMAIYESMVGPRWWDDLEFGRLWMNIDELPGRDLTEEQCRAIETVADVIRVVSRRRSVEAGS